MTQFNYIAIRTCNRPAFLQRLLASLSRRKSHQASVVLVFDDSRQAGIQQKNQQVVASAQRRFSYEVRYLGTAWQEGFCSELIQRFPGDADSIRWLLDARAKGVFSGGRLFNIIMLALAGHRFTLFDDDFKLDRARHLGSGNNRKLKWSHDPERQMPAFDSVRAARAAGQEFPIDPIDAHLEFLGRRLGDCLASESGPEALLDDSQSGQPPDRTQVNKDSVILTTVNGQYGVPIAPNSIHLFYQIYQKSLPVWLDADKYKVLRRGRAMWNVTYTHVVSGRTGSTPSGIDNRILMPPTLPLCKGEDTLFCTFLKFIHPNAANLYLPWAIEHSRKPINWPVATFDERQKLLLGKTLWKKTEDVTPLAAHLQSAEDRSEFLARYMLNWSGKSIPAFKDDLCKAFEKGVRWRIRVTSESLDQVEDTKSQVYRDLQRGLRAFEASLDLSQGLPELMDNPGIKGDIQRVEWVAKVIREFAQSLLIWPGLWAAAKDMQVLERH